MEGLAITKDGEKRLLEAELPSSSLLVASQINPFMGN